jgi:hypothetical protein
MNQTHFSICITLFCILMGTLCVFGCADNADSAQVPVGSPLSEEEHAFYTMMVEYWIPDLYEIKGGMLIALRASTGFDDLFKAACQDGMIRLEKNIAEMNQYTLTGAAVSLRTAYITYAQDILSTLSQVESVDQTQPEWALSIEKSMNALSMYASWLTYSAIDAFSTSNIAHQDYASLSKDDFLQVVKEITDA